MYKHGLHKDLVKFLTRIGALLRNFLQKNELTDLLIGSKGVIRSIGLFSAVINILALVPSLYMLQVYDRVMTSQNITTLTVLTLLTMGLLVLSALLDASRTFILVRVGAKFDMTINRRIYTAAFQHYLRTGQQVASQSLRDLTNLRQFVTGPGLLAFFDLPWMPLYLVVLFLFDFWMGMLAIFGIVVSATLTWMNDRSSGGPLKEASELAAKSGRVADENVRNAEVIEAMGMMDSFMGRWRKEHGQFLSLQAVASDKAGLWTSASKNFRIFLQSAALGLGALLALQNEITPGMMIAASILMGRALSPLDQLIATYKQFSAAKISYARLVQLLEASPAREKGLQLPNPSGHVQFDSVFGGAPNSEVALIQDVSFSVPAGTVLGVIGPSGAGKSSLVRTLIGVWSSKKGTVRIDGADIQTWDREKLGPYIGYLPQDVELFEGTVATNISRFREGEPDEMVIEAAMAAGVHDMILRLPQGYDTVLGPQGAGLSGGQRQRIALARALYGKPSLIVLDEPNASLDDAGVLALITAIRKFKEMGKTVVIVTHRADMLRVTDALLLMQNGRVGNFGPSAKVLEGLQTRSIAGGQHVA